MRLEQQLCWILAQNKLPLLLLLLKLLAFVVKYLFCSLHMCVHSDEVKKVSIYKPLAGGAPTYNGMR